MWSVYHRNFGNELLPFKRQTLSNFTIVSERHDVKLNIVSPYNHRSCAVLAMLGELPRIKKRISDPARLASTTYRITWNLLSIQIVAMTSKFPGRPTRSMTAWTPARTCEKTMIANCYNVMMLLINSQNIPCKSILTNRWCFHLQVAKTEFPLTL